MSFDALFFLLGIGTIVAPALLLCLIGGPLLLGPTLSERTTARATQLAVVAGLIMSISILALMLISGQRNISIEIGNFAVIPAEHFHFHLRFMFDRLSCPPMCCRQAS